MQQKTIVSGAQTTGNLHLGNYLGAINQWLELQNNYNCYFFLADLHAITNKQAIKELRDSTLQSIALYLACGLDPEKSTIFVQSHLSEHTQLAWLFNCVAPLGWLKRMTQFKDKAGKEQDLANVGLFTYPLLMAADILLYNADYVPVGEDQKQHLELARDLAGLINRQFDQNLFTYPQALISTGSARIMSLRDGRQKMSKSAISDFSRINLTDPAELIIKKLKKAKTDELTYMSYDKETRPELANLLNIYAQIVAATPQQIIDQYQTAKQTTSFAAFKADLAEIIIQRLAPIQEKYHQFLKDELYLEEVARKGAEKAKKIASKNYQLIAKKFGFF